MIYDMYDCPNCGKSYEIDYHDYKFCPEFGEVQERLSEVRKDYLKFKSGIPF